MIIAKLIEHNEVYPKAISAFAVNNFLGDENQLEAYLTASEDLDTPFYFMISAGPEKTDESEENKFIHKADLLQKIPLDRLLICTDSPKYTPQNIEDPYVRQSRNEPSNLPYILQAVSDILQIPLDTLSTQLYENSNRFFGFSDDFETPAEKEAEAEATEGSTTDSSPAADVSNAPPSSETPGEAAETANNPPASNTGQPEVSYRCRMCRQVLGTSFDVIPHEQGLENLRELLQLRDELDFDSANIMFFSPASVQWVKDRMEQQAKFGRQEGKLDCPKCAGKSIGTFYGGIDVPLFTLKTKRLDIMRSNASLSTANPLEEFEDEDDDQPNKKGGKKKKRNQKKNVKATNRSNMGNFRNKDFGGGAKKTPNAKPE